MTTEAAPSPPEVSAPATSALPIRTFLFADVRTERSASRAAVRVRRPIWPS
jgi:hypothetical protein